MSNFVFRWNFFFLSASNEGVLSEADKKQVYTEFLETNVSQIQTVSQLHSYEQKALSLQTEKEWEAKQGLFVSQITVFSIRDSDLSCFAQ